MTVETRNVTMKLLPVEAITSTEVLTDFLEGSAFTGHMIPNNEGVSTIVGFIYPIGGDAGSAGRRFLTSGGYVVRMHDVVNILNSGALAKYGVEV